MEHYLTFSIAGETCAVGIDEVETVLENVGLSRVSGAPDYLAGLLDLRGEAIPVVDVRRKLGLGANADSTKGCIIVLSLETEDGERRPVGALVDSVSEVVELSGDAVRPAGDFAVAFDGKVVRGIAKGNSGFITVIAAARLVEARAHADRAPGSGET
jgi:purine-binding chemotaxis protein CheW